MVLKICAGASLLCFPPPTWQSGQVRSESYPLSSKDTFKPRGTRYTLFHFFQHADFSITTRKLSGPGASLRQHQRKLRISRKRAGGYNNAVIHSDKDYCYECRPFRSTPVAISVPYECNFSYVTSRPTRSCAIGSIGSMGSELSFQIALIAGKLKVSRGNYRFHFPPRCRHSMLLLLNFEKRLFICYRR
jgi:hypothetical protein